MANFCMKCGARLTPGSRFCTQCGAPVTDMGVRVSEDGRGGLKIEAPEGSTVSISDPKPGKDNGIKVKEDGKGGLVFDVPEGSTVEVSDPLPAAPARKRTRPRTVKQPEIKKEEKKAKPAAAKKGSGKGPSKMLIVLLAAALGFTAFVKPGFLVPKDKPGYESTTLSGRPGGTATAKPQTETPRELSEEVPAFTEDIGTSAAIDASPAEGVHVSAAAGAFDNNTEIAFTPADENDPAVIAADEMLKEEGLYAIAGWEVDAGLSDDEQMPGQYDVTIDLDTLDIDPAFYDYLKVVRVGDDGEYYTYRTELDGSQLRYSSNQNSFAFVCIITGAVLLFAENEYIQRNKYYVKNAGPMKNNPGATDLFKRQVMKLDGSNAYASWTVEWRMDDINPDLADKMARLAQIEAQCMADAEEYRKTLGIFSRFRENYHVEKYFQEELAANEEHARLLKELQVPEIIEYINECIDVSFKYLAEQEKIRMPLHEVPFKIMNVGGDLAHAITRKASLSYVDVHLANVNRDSREDRDNLLLTLTHEACHICQNMYRLPVDAITDDTRFDEMVVIMVENNAKQWYQDKAYIITDPQTTDVNNWGSLRLPANSMAQGLEGNDLNRLLINEGYNLGDFLMYLRDDCGLKVTAAKLMKARSLTAKATTSAPVCAALGLSEKEFDQYWRNWFISRRKVISANMYDQIAASPYKRLIRSTIVEPGKEYPVKLERDESYFLRLRGFVQKTRNTDQPVVMIPDDNLREVFPEATLVPAATYYNTAKGVFIPAFVDYSVSNNWLGIMEIHGAVGQAKTSGEAGYMLYALDQTKKPVLEDDPDNAALIIHLPELEGYAKKGIIDGWQVTLKTSTGVKASNYPGIDKAGRSLKVHYADIWDKDNPYSPIDVEVTFTEYVTDTKGTRHLGIQSETAEITITPKKIKTEGAFIPYDGPVYIIPEQYTVGSVNFLFNSITGYAGLDSEEWEPTGQKANAIMGQPHLTITEDGHFTLTIPAMPKTTFGSEDGRSGLFDVSVDSFSFSGQAVAGYKPRWGYTTDKVNGPADWIAENSQFTMTPASVTARRDWYEDKVSHSDYLWANNGIDEYGRQWIQEEYMTTNQFGDPIKGKRWRLTVHYEVIWNHSLPDGERQFHVYWNEAENRYDFWLSAYMTRQVGYYEDGNLSDDHNKTGTFETAVSCGGYFYGEQP